MQITASRPNPEPAQLICWMNAVMNHLVVQARSSSALLRPSGGGRAPSRRVSVSTSAPHRRSTRLPRGVFQPGVRLFVLTPSAFSSLLAKISCKARTDSDCSSTKAQMDRSAGTFWSRERTLDGWQCHIHPDDKIYIFHDMEKWRDGPWKVIYRKRPVNQVQDADPGSSSPRLVCMLGTQQYSLPIVQYIPLLLVHIYFLGEKKIACFNPQKLYNLFY